MGCSALPGLTPTGVARLIRSVKGPKHVDIRGSRSARSGSWSRSESGLPFKTLSPSCGSSRVPTGTGAKKVVALFLIPGTHHELLYFRLRLYRRRRSAQPLPAKAANMCFLFWQPVVLQA